MMEQNLSNLAPISAAILAAMLGGLLGWVGPFRRRLVGLVGHSVLAAAIAMSVSGAVSLDAWPLPPIARDHAMGAVIAGVCLLGATTTLRRRNGLARRLAASASLLFTALVASLVGSQEPMLAIGAAAVAFVALVAPDPPVVQTAAATEPIASPSASRSTVRRDFLNRLHAELLQGLLRRVGRRGRRGALPGR